MIGATTQIRKNAANENSSPIEIASYLRLTFMACRGFSPANACHHEKAPVLLPLLQFHSRFREFFSCGKGRRPCHSVADRGPRDRGLVWSSNEIGGPGN